MKGWIPILAGPTASGKTALAIRLGQVYPLEVVNADATMVYKGLDIGTDKPTPEELCGVPHHLIDIVEPDQPFDVVQWVERAEAAIAGILARGRTPLVVGGTGYYIRTLSEGYHALPPPNTGVQAALWKELEERGAGALVRELERASPADALRVQGNPRRLVRALEVLRTAGVPPSAFPKRPPRFRYRKLVLWPERAWLRPRIRARAEAQFARGLVEEVRRLLERYPRMPTALQAIGYKEVVRYLRGEWSLERAVEEDWRGVWRYARRQYTWFRREPGDVTYLPRGGEAAWVGVSDWFGRYFGGR